MTVTRQASKSSPSREWTRSEKLLVGVVPFVLLLLFAIFEAWSSIDGDPVFHIPPRAVPSPNAYVYYRNAAFSVAYTWPMPGTWKPSSGRPATLDDLNDPSTMAAAVALVKTNAPAIAIAAQGMAYPNVAPPIRSWQQMFPIFRFNHLAAAVALDGEVAAREGNIRECVRVGVIGLHAFGGVQGVTTWEAKQMINGEDQVRSMLWRHVDSFNSAQSRQIAATAEAAADNAAPAWASLGEEKYFQEAVIAETFRKPNWRFQMMPYIYSLKSANDDIGQDWQIATISKRRIVANFDSRIDTLIADAHHGVDIPAEPPSTDSITNGLIGDDEDLSSRCAVDVAEDRLLACYCAERAYCLDHHADPSSLSQLVPAYLPSVPADPFDGGRPLRYRIVDGRPVIYSIGPDRRDDGGKPVSEAQPRPAATYTLQVPQNLKEATGDIVAGKNNDLIDLWF